MEPVIYQNPDEHGTKESFWDKFAHLPGEIESRVPTLDKSLDAYFDRHFVGIIEEWELLTEIDLEKFEHRLSRITDDISDLYAERVKTESRARELDGLIASMERGP
jgi:hypothetical protein